MQWCRTDEERAKAEAIEAAIGEVSPEEAVLALKQWIHEQPMRPSIATYLGDSVYVDRWHDGLVLTTQNDQGPPSNIIYLEPEVLDALQVYLARRLLWRAYHRAVTKEKD
jgi:hypothetical protein